jgi:hypothetical protein
MWATTTEKKTGLQSGSVRFYGFFRSIGLNLQTLPGGALVLFPLLDSGEFVRSWGRSRSSGAKGSTIKVAPKAFGLDGILKAQRKYGPVKAVSIELGNVGRKDVVEGSGGSRHGSKK